MRRYRIIGWNGRYYPQYRGWFAWWTLVDPWSMRQVYSTIDEAREAIQADVQRRKPAKVVEEWKERA